MRRLFAISLLLLSACHKEEQRHVELVQQVHSEAEKQVDVEAQADTVVKRVEAPDRTTITEDEYYPPPPLPPPVPGKPLPPAPPPALKSHKVTVTENGQVVVEKQTRAEAKAEEHDQVKTEEHVALKAAADTVTEVGPGNRFYIWGIVAIVIVAGLFFAGRKFHLL